MTEPNEPAPTLDARFRETQRTWLAMLGILDRPWLIFGAAPGPTLPGDIVRTHARIDINNSGRTAQELGLGPADLTFRKRSKPWAEHQDLHTRGLIWYRNAPLVFMKIELALKRRAKVDHLMRVTRGERDTIVDLMAGTNLRAVGSRGKATNGIAAACYGLYVGVPEVVLSGVSLSKDGHSYNEVGRKRRQTDEDRLVLSKIKDAPNLFTTEPDLAAEAGLKLWQDSHVSG
jgi:hypothetical protein